MTGEGDVWSREAYRPHPLPGVLGGGGLGVMGGGDGWSHEAYRPHPLTLLPWDSCGDGVGVVGLHLGCCPVGMVMGWPVMVVGAATEMRWRKAIRNHVAGRDVHVRGGSYRAYV